jgi:hypothetical protein
LQGEGTSLDSSADPTLREDILSTLYGGHLRVNGHEEAGEDDKEEEEAAESGVGEGQQEEEPEVVVEKEESKENNAHVTTHGKTEEDEEEVDDDDERHDGKHEEDSVSKEEPAPAKPDKAGAVCMSRKPVCCGMTFHTESALREHFRLSHPTQSFKAHMDSLAAGDTLLASRRPRVRTNKNGLQRVVATGRSPR